ncbi:MAG: hypothetical protein COV59_03460 [Candidatus Magasanikbacteria bacterium CG11_big_fil_rev_8_21_14_0_20_39_34]|uniref:50S ribosomal protein L7/L12 n=1 Tax=Candidatus Magasanikbacteria bacterium CG11_big_fil_rev_8_21_14_0_20_39_34 TaxID=1974653 RepID=A0A2H0N5P0_9BACT|nr:MAG: hypothetical protein COV59_03460 [Candidatus Magasanikbacteria bacterium CG11_big_fil_rev_8_21_14_0_20_39_34]
MQNTNPNNDFFSDDSSSFLSTPPQTLPPDDQIMESSSMPVMQNFISPEPASVISAEPSENNQNEVVDTHEFVSMIHGMQDQLDAMLKMISGRSIPRIKNSKQKIHAEDFSSNERIVEGVFNGEKMVGPDGEEFSIPPNYASKSKLVEGDLMKLTISQNGSFIYKQTSPVPRKRLVGELVSNSDNGHWNAIASGRTYQLLTASVTFFKGKPGDEVILLVPEDGQSSWAAVENIINK